MTEIIFYKSKEGDFQRFICKGHAGYANQGNDIVCSAISILVINTINALEELLKLSPEVYTDEATGMIDCKFDTPLDERGKLLLDTLELGCRSIEKQYKKFCKVKIQEV